MTVIIDALKNGGLLSMTKPETASVGISENAASMVFNFAVLSPDGTVSASGNGNCFIECKYFSLAGLYPIKDLSCKLSVKNSIYELCGVINKDTNHLSCSYSKDSESLGKFFSVDKHLSSWTFEHINGKIFNLREKHEKILGIMPTPVSEIFIDEKLFITINESDCKSSDKYNPFMEIINKDILYNLIDDDLFVLILIQHFAYSALHFRRTAVN